MRALEVEAEDLGLGFSVCITKPEGSYLQGYLSGWHGTFTWPQDQVPKEFGECRGWPTEPEGDDVVLPRDLQTTVYRRSDVCRAPCKRAKHSVPRARHCKVLASTLPLVSWD